VLLYDFLPGIGFSVRIKICGKGISKNFFEGIQNCCKKKIWEGLLLGDSLKILVVKI
jgi:hypothetical protein